MFAVMPVKDRMVNSTKYYKTHSLILEFLIKDILFICISKTLYVDLAGYKSIYLILETSL